MLSTFRRRLTGRNELEAANSAPQGSEPPTAPSRIDSELWQLQLDEFTTQRMEHNRLFFEQLNELDSGHRVRQEQFSSFLRNVRLAFDAAQARRHDEWRTAQNDLRDYAIRMQESCATQSEGARTAAAREGLLRCEERAAHLRGLFDTALAQPVDHPSNSKYYRAERNALRTRLRSILDDQSDIGLAQSTAPNIPSPHHHSLEPNSQSLSTGLPNASAPALPPQFDVLSQPDTQSPGLLVTAAELEDINSVTIADPGETPAFRRAFSQLEAIRYRIWGRMCGTHSGSLDAWEAAFRDLEAELSAVFLSHPCVNGESGDAVILAVTMLVAFRGAESRREVELERIWRCHIRGLEDILQRWVHLQRSALRRVMPICGNPCRDESESEESNMEYHGYPQLPFAPGFQPQCLVRVPDIAGPLPVVSRAQRQLEAFRRQQHIFEREVSRRQSTHRAHGQLSEAKLDSHFATALSHWETRAAQAELRRSSEFAHALERVRKLHTANVAQNCHDVAMSLEREFVGSQRFREDTFFSELERLHRQLLQACHEFRDNLSMAQPNDLEAESAAPQPVPIAEMSSN